ncbi:MAG: transposase [Bacteroidota bacterium]
MVYETGKYYHVYNRGAHGQEIFVSDENFRFCISLLKKYSSHFLVSIHTFCLMPNHYHLLLQQHQGGSIRSFIQTTFNAYSQAFNKVYQHSGTLFQGRAKGKDVESDLYAVRLSRYIHRNPITAKLVSDASEWIFSDYRVWIGEEASMLTDLGLRNGYFTDASHYREWFGELEYEGDLSRFLFQE